MKAFFDICQVLLTDGGLIGAMAWVIACLVFWQAAKLLSTCYFVLAWIWRHRWDVLLRPSKSTLVLVLCSAFLAWCFRLQINDQIQYIEQAYISPEFVQPDTSTHALAIYEAELSKRVDPYELEIIKRRTGEIAAKVGTTPLAIYEVAYSECGLDPFRVRTDGIAAGWIQFTTAGLSGLVLNGKPATLSAVKELCKNRRTLEIMNLTEQYFLTRAKGKPMPRACDVYCCVFAPGYIGRPDDTVLYSGWSNPAYYLNAGLDGYYLQGDQIFRSRKACDGKITISDLNLALQSKKAQLFRCSKFSAKS